MKIAANLKSIKNKMLQPSVIIFIETIIGLGIIKSFRYTFFLPIGISLLLFSYLKPLFGLSMVIISIAFLRLTIMSAGGVGIEAVQLVSFILAVTWLINIVVKRKILFQRTTLDIPLLILSAWAIMSLAWSGDVSKSTMIGSAGKVVFVTVLYFLFTNILTSKKDINTALWVWLFAMSLGFLYGMISPETAFSKHGIAGYAETGGQQTKNHFNLYVNFSIYYIVALIPFSQVFTKRILIGLGIIFGIISVFLAASIGGIVSLAAGLIFIAFRYNLLSKTSIFSLFVVIFIFFTIFVLVKSQIGYSGLESNSEYGALSNVASFFSSYQEFIRIIRDKLFRKDKSGRAQIWAAAIEELRDTNGLGIGLGRSRIGSVYNIYLQTVTDFGFVGGVLFLWLVSSAIKSIRNAQIRSKGTPCEFLVTCFGGGLIMLSIYGMVDFTLYDPMLWSFVGVGMAAVNVAAQHGG